MPHGLGVRLLRRLLSGGPKPVRSRAEHIAACHRPLDAIAARRQAGGAEPQHLVRRLERLFHQDSIVGSDRWWPRLAGTRGPARQEKHRHNPGFETLLHGLNGFLERIYSMLLDRQAPIGVSPRLLHALSEAQVPGCVAFLREKLARLT